MLKNGSQRGCQQGGSLPLGNRVTRLGRYYTPPESEVSKEKLLPYVVFAVCFALDYFVYILFLVAFVYGLTGRTIDRYPLLLRALKKTRDLHSIVVS